MTQQEIIRASGLSPNRVSALLNDSTIKSSIEAKRAQIYGHNLESRIKKTGLKAVDTAESIMDDPDTPPATRLTAAHDFMDRILGKPRPSGESEKSSIRELFEALDSVGLLNKQQEKQVFESTPAAVPALPLPQQSQNNPDKLDSWLEENLDD